MPGGLAKRREGVETGALAGSRMTLNRAQFSGQPRVSTVSDGEPQIRAWQSPDRGAQSRL
jgi:hypothetical protein